MFQFVVIATSRKKGMSGDVTEVVTKRRCLRVRLQSKRFRSLSCLLQKQLFFLLFDKYVYMTAFDELIINYHTEMLPRETFPNLKQQLRDFHLYCLCN